MALDWDALFGDADSLTLEQFKAKLAGRKVVDLADGDYVGKEKFDAEVKKAKEAAKAAADELADLKAATDGDDGLRKQLDAAVARADLAVKERDDALRERDGVTVRLTSAERAARVSEKVPDRRFARLALLDAEALVTDEVDFDTALDKVLADNPDYAPAPDEDGKTPIRVDTGAPNPGKPPAKAEDKDLAAFVEGLHIPGGDDKKE